MKTLIKLYKAILRMRLHYLEGRLEHVNYFLPKSRGWQSRDLYTEQADLMGEISYIKRKLGIDA